MVKGISQLTFALSEKKFSKVLMKFYLAENIFTQLQLDRSNSYQETGHAMLKTAHFVIYHRHQKSSFYRESLAFGNLSNF